MHKDKRVLFMRRIIFNTIKEAIKDFAKHAIPLTDKTNKEHAAVIRRQGSKYYYTKIDKGFHRTVWPTALKYAAVKGEKYFLHTHPNHGTKDASGKHRDNNPFSGNPGSRNVKDAGDAYVVDVLGYDGIYLISAMGNAYLYEGVGIHKPKNNTHANSKSELRALKPVMTGLTKSKYYYKLIDKNKRIKRYKKQRWQVK